jgi:hypothetical protein
VNKRNILIPAMLFLTVFLLSSCSKNSYPKKVIVTDGNTQGLPPGQAKKVYGTRSAKPFAPGQQKKSGGTTVVIN